LAVAVVSGVFVAAVEELVAADSTVHHFVKLLEAAVDVG